DDQVQKSCLFDQRLVSRAQDCWTRNIYRRRNETDEKNCCGNRSQSGNGFHNSGNPIVRLPKRDYFHYVRHPAGDDKDAETNKHPVEGQIATFSDEKDQRDRNDEIGGGDQKIRNQMQSHQSRIPKVTMAVRHEAVLTKETRKQIYTT